MSCPTTPTKPIRSDPKITWAPMRKQKDYNPFVLGDFQPYKIGLVHVESGASFATEQVATVSAVGGAGDISSVSNNMSSLNLGSNQ